MSNQTTARRFDNPIIKDSVEFVEMTAETGGERLRLHIELAPSGGNPPHHHTQFSETFTAIKGVLGVQLNGRKMLLQPGESATVPIGASHCFFNPSDTETIEFEVLIEPGSRGFEIALQVAYGLSRDGQMSASMTPKNISHLALLVEWSDTHPDDWARLLTPVLGWLARRAKRRGVGEALIQKYCRY